MRIDLDRSPPRRSARAAAMFFGHSSRVVQGERMRPIKTTWPSAAIAAGSSSSWISPSRVANIGAPLAIAAPFSCPPATSPVANSAKSHKHIFISELKRRNMTVTLDGLVDTLKAAAETSRLRILALLSRGDLTVSDLTEILNQSQPRVSRHLKLLLEAGLIGRYQEGSWAFFRWPTTTRRATSCMADRRPHRYADPQIERDLERLARGETPAAGEGGGIFQRQRGKLGRDTLAACARPRRRGGVAQARRQAAVPVHARPRHRHRPAARNLFAALSARRRHRHVARNAGGRPRQPRQGRRRAMRRCARATSTRRRSSATAFDLVTIHQVLHYLDDPALAIREAARLLRPAGGW